MKIKKSKLREILTEFGVNEGALTKLISKIKSKNKMKTADKSVKKLEKGIFSLLKDVPSATDEEREELMKSLGF